MIGQWWAERVLPWWVDRSCGTTEIDALRSDLCVGLSGRVLEVGFGSGLNVRHYPRRVTEVVAVEPSDRAWELAQPRLGATAATIRRAGRDGQRLEEPDASVDHVVVAFTLCTIPDHLAALREISRVLRPGGRLHFLEHGRGPTARVRSWQRRLEPFQRRVGGGCHLTRDPVAAAEGAGFAMEELDTHYLAGGPLLHPFGYVYTGVARKQ